MPQLSRRHFLRNLSLGSGSFLLSPLVDQLSLHAAGVESKFPQRFVFLIKSSGLTPAAITPDSLKEKTADRRSSKIAPGMRSDGRWRDDTSNSASSKLRLAYRAISR